MQGRESPSLLYLKCGLHIPCRLFLFPDGGLLQVLGYGEVIVARGKRIVTTEDGWGLEIKVVLGYQVKLQSTVTV